jgi:hypothetical protein
MSKPDDIPDENPTQSTSAFCWWDQSPCGSGYWSVFLFRDTIGSSKSTAGRQAYEWQAQASTDTCTFPNSTYPAMSLTGTGWWVGYYYFNNEMDYDYVGLDPQVVNYYIQQGRVPCTMSTPQTMDLFVNTSTGQYSSRQYFTDTLTISIQQGWYGIAKNGVQAWRQY